MARTPRGDDAGDDETPAPPKTKPAVKARLVEDDDADEAPRKKKKGKTKPATDGKKKLIIGGAIAGVLFTIACLAVVVFLVVAGGGPRTPTDNPKVAYLDYIAALEANDAGRAWERMDQEAQNAMVKEYTAYANEAGPKAEKYKGKTGKAL